VNLKKWSSEAAEALESVLKKNKSTEKKKSEESSLENFMVKIKD